MVVMTELQMKKKMLHRQRLVALVVVALVVVALVVVALVVVALVVVALGVVVALVVVDTRSVAADTLLHLSSQPQRHLAQKKAVVVVVVVEEQLVGIAQLDQISDMDFEHSSVVVVR